MDFRLLGPLEVVGDGGLPLSIGTGRQRALLALLVLRANELVGRDRLVNELWGESPPATAQQMLHNQVSALRQALGRNGRLETHGSGYRLKVDPGERDVDRFEGLVARGRAQMEADPERAAETLRRALDLWRGPPLSDLAYEPFAQTEIARLEERRWVAFEARVEAELALGRHADLVSELEAVVAEQPLREHLQGQLMLALYRCGRQAEALEAFRRARRTLVDAVGVEPGSELRELQAAILAQDPALDFTSRAEELPPALDGGSPLLAGRERELAELRERLAKASAGRGALVFVRGPRGIGKTRLAAELARDALRERMVVLYAGAGSSPDEALAAVRGAGDRGRSALLILDDADDASAALLDGAAVLARDVADRPLLVMVLHRGPEPPGFAGLSGGRIELQPLSVEAVAEIARLYLPAGAKSLPVGTLAAESEGVPLAVHRAAAEWARVGAAELLADSAGRAAAERGDLRAAEARLAGDVLDLQAAGPRGRLYATAADDATPSPAVCPFVGLAPFDAEHAEYFFGRERLVAEMVARLVGAPLLSVVGPSGSGKSSAVRAGLLPALASGVLPGSERWRQVLMRPGEHPLAELKRLFPEASLPRGERVALVVDQFEEVFTACRDDAERSAFLDALVDGARDRNQRILVVLAMRADFYGRCASHDELARLVGANQVLVGPMRRGELRRAIELPARRAGLRVEPSLTDALIADVLGEPGGLPLLSASLVELWRERDGRVMRHAAYERTGGVRAAVGRLAEHTYTQLSEPERRAARGILMRLAAAGEEEEAVFVRQRLPFDELDLERDEHAAAALAALTASRLVTTGEGAAEVAHEALLREWPRLRAWLEEDAESRRLHQHLIHAARHWQSAGRDPGELYRGARLASALDWAADHDAELNDVERAFLDESRAASGRAQRRLRAGLVALAALLVLAVIAGLLALDQRGKARDEAVASDAQRLGALALLEDDLDRALLLARQGVALDDTVQTRGNLLAALLKSPAAIGVIRAESGRIEATALSPDEHTLAVGNSPGRILLFDTRTRQRVATLRPGSKDAFILSLAYSPDGRRLAVVHLDNPEARDPSLVVTVLNVPSRRSVAKLTLSEPYVSGMQFSPDGRTLGIMTLRDWPNPAAIFARFDASTGRRVFGPVRVNRHGWSPLLVTSDGRRIVVVGGGEVTLRDATTLAVLRRFSVDGLGASPVPDHPDTSALSSDGHTLAVGDENGSVRLLDLRSGKTRTASGGHEAAVREAQFAPDGRRLITTGEDGDVIVWNVRTAAPAETLRGHAGSVFSPQITRDGTTLFTASRDGTVLVWDLGGARRLGRPFRIGAGHVGDSGIMSIIGPMLSSDGRLLARGRDDGTISVAETDTLKRREPLRVAGAGWVSGIGFLPGSQLFMVAGRNGLIAVVDIDRRRVVRRLRADRRNIDGGSISADGRLLATFGAHAVSLWSLPKERPLGPPLRFPSALVGDAQLSPDGRWLAVPLFEQPGAMSARTLEVWDVRSRRLVARRRLEGVPLTKFSPDGRLLAVGDIHGRARVWSTDSWEPVTRWFVGHTDMIAGMAIGRDGRTLATGGGDGTVRLWDIETEQAIGAPLPGLPNVPVWPLFTPDGTRLIAAYESGDAYRWDIRPESLARQACRVAGRRLTRTEWTEFLPGRDYDPAC